jgi:sterol desaturase/sphingolipid hydroxylase (fatty acid hydroxylase superfamily)
MDRILLIPFTLTVAFLAAMIVGSSQELLKSIVLVGSAVLAIIMIARWLEARWPIEPNQPHDEVMSDWKVVLANLLLFYGIEPLSFPISAAIVERFGGGLIQLPIDGGWYVVSTTIVFLISDLHRYWTHRLTHMVPFLWAMHSFHHSANALTIVTGARHFWVEKILTGALLPILPILFVIPSGMATIVSFIYFLPDGCAHLNVRIPMGRAITWVNSPQWHRIHHSVLPEHFNKNFAGALPLWDFVFGTAWVPGRDEYPATGLVPAEKVSVIDSVIWPLRHLRRSKWINSTQS